MRIEELANNMVYKEGSEFWVTADKAHSSWSHKLDWYINFLIAKVSKVKKQELSKDLKEIIHEEKLQVPAAVNLKNPNLYISTKQFLPNQGLMVIPYLADDIKWLDSLKDLWQNMDKPSLRIFLPKGMQKDTFLNYCKDHLGNDITYVIEENYPSYRQ